MPAIHLRTDQPLHAQLAEIARSEGLSLNSYLLRIARADVARRQRMASAAGLHRMATDAELASALEQALSQPLTPVEQQHLPREPGAAVAYAVARAAKRGSKPAPAPSTKPAPTNGSKPTTRSAATKPEQRPVARPGVEPGATVRTPSGTYVADERGIFVRVVAHPLHEPHCRGRCACSRGTATWRS